MGEDNEFRLKHGEGQVPVGHSEGCPGGSWTDKPGAGENWGKEVFPQYPPASGGQVVALMKACAEGRGGACERIKEGS